MIDMKTIDRKRQNNIQMKRDRWKEKQNYRQMETQRGKMTRKIERHTDAEIERQNDRKTKLWKDRQNYIDRKIEQWKRNNRW